MKTNKFLTTVVLCTVVAFTLASCQKETLKTVDGLNAVTHQTVHNTYGVWKHETSAMYFYSDIFPIRSLLGSKVTIQSTLDNQLMLCQSGDTTFQKSTSIILDNEDLFIDMYRYTTVGLNVPNCSEKSVAFMLFYFPPKAGEYQFFLQIENPEQGIYYRTPSYRYSITEDASNKDWFRTSIIEL